MATVEAQDLRSSGCYLYKTNGETVAREPWSVRTDSNGVRHVVAERDAGAFGVQIRVTAKSYPNGNSNAQLELRSAHDGPLRKQAQYRVHGGVVSWRENEGQDWQIVGPHGAHFFGLMRIFTGDMVLALHKMGGQGAVIVPSIVSLGRDETVFKPLMSERTVVKVADEKSAFDLSGGAYEAPARLFLDQDGLLQHYDFTDAAGQKWDCSLVDT